MGSGKMRHRVDRQKGKGRAAACELGVADFHGAGGASAGVGWADRLRACACLLSSSDSAITRRVQAVVSIQPAAHCSLGYGQTWILWCCRRGWGVCSWRPCNAGASNTPYVASDKSQNRAILQGLRKDTTSLPASACLVSHCSATVQPCSRRQRLQKAASSVALGRRSPPRRP